MHHINVRQVVKMFEMSEHLPLYLINGSAYSISISCCSKRFLDSSGISVDVESVFKSWSPRITVRLCQIVQLRPIWPGLQMQWAAVSTILVPINAPPQKWPKPSKLIRAIHGFEWGLTWQESGPAIFLWSSTQSKPSKEKINLDTYPMFQYKSI